MANTITGSIRKITPVQEITGKSGNTFAKRILVLDAARYDTHTGERKFDNYPSFEFSGDAMKQLDNYKEGDYVTVSYDINGREFEDPNTHETKYFNTIRGYKVEPYGKRDDLPPSAPAGSTATKAPVAQPQDGEEKSDLPF